MAKKNKSGIKRIKGIGVPYKKQGTPFLIPRWFYVCAGDTQHIPYEYRQSI